VLVVAPILALAAAALPATEQILGRGYDLLFVASCISAGPCFGLMLAGSTQNPAGAAMFVAVLTAPALALLLLASVRRSVVWPLAAILLWIAIGYLTCVAMWI
jgi:hypothetical protein